MRALVVYCHPVEGSYCSAMRDAAIDGLQRAGHHVDVIDLAAIQFDPIMSREEWELYRTSKGAIPVGLEEHIALVKQAEILVFVYPTWWSSLPAQLKGWVERVMIYGVAYSMNSKNKVRPALTQVKHIYIFSTFGSPRWYVAFIQNNGKRVLSRALRLCTGRARCTSRALYAMDTQTNENRQDFLMDITRLVAQ
jgi:NAD(P)H dehydrogenase (quinone)